MHRVLTGFVLMASCAFSQEARPVAGLSGRVLDPSGGAVPQAAVRVHSRDSGTQRTAVSNAQGEYYFEQLPPGEYLVEARTGGLDQASPVAVRLEGRNTTLDLNLEVRGLATRVLVTAEAAPQSTVEAGKAMDVVDSAEIARREEFLFSEVLRQVPGMRVQQLGGPGSFTRVLARGLRAADTAVLMDGMRFRDPASVQGDATAFIGDLQMVNGDRVEVLRGSGSSLYGTNATGGVVNMVTDQGGGAARGEVAAEGGGLGVARGMARIAGGLREDRIQYSAGLAHLNVRSGVDGIERVRNTTGHGFAQWRPSAATSLSARVLGTVSMVGVNSAPFAAPAANLPPTGFVRAVPLDPAQAALGDRGLPFAWGGATFAPNFFDPDSRRIANFNTTMLAWTQQAGPRFNYRVAWQGLGSNRDNRDGPGGSGFQPAFNSATGFGGRIDTLNARADAALARWNLFTAGYEFERETFHNPVTDANPDPVARINARSQIRQRSHIAFAQNQTRLLNDRLQISLSGRWQSFQLSRPLFQGGAPRYEGVALAAPPNAYTGDAAVSYFIPRTSTKLRAHAGNAYRAPSLYERFGTAFFFGAFTPLGDPRLRPERTVAFDFGIDQYFANSRFRASATYFYTRLQEVAGFAPLADDPFGRIFGGFANMGGGLARGVELSLEARPWRSMLIQSSYTHTNADERNPFLVGGVLSSIRIFPNAFTLIATQQVTRRIQVTADFWAADNYISGVFFVFEAGGNRPFIFPGPRRLDVSASYSLPLGERRTLRFFTRAENLLNQRYFEDGFRVPRAWATGGVRLLF
jgi:iron complex outermembrane receptor protein